MIRKKKVKRKVVFYTHLSSLSDSVKEDLLKKLKSGDLPKEWKNTTDKQRKKIEKELRRKNRALLAKTPAQAATDASKK